MNSNLISRRKEEIQYWMEEAKKDYQSVLEGKSEKNIISRIQKLNFTLLSFKEINVPTMELVIEMASSSLSAYKAVGLEEPTIIEIVMFDNSLKIDLSSKEREDIAKSVFPNLSVAYRTMQEILENYDKIQEKLVSETREELKKLLDGYEEVLARTEKRMVKSATPLAEDLISAIAEVNVVEKLLRREIQRFRVKGTDLWARCQAKKYSIYNELEDTFPGQHGFVHYKVVHDRSPMLNEDIITPELDERYQNMQARFHEISNSIKEFQEQVKHSDKVYEVLDQLNPEFPINLQRLAELTELDKNITERTLGFVLELTPEIGKYDKMSQMLVFDKPEKVRKAVRSKRRIKCLECKSKLKSTDEKCSNCGKKFDICPICRGIITIEPTKDCSSCGRLFHKNHLEEWMNTNSNCPMCKKKL